MPGGFNPDDYVPVSERLTAFYEKHPDGSVQSDIIELSEKRVVMRATVYRTPTDERPSIAHSALGIPGTTGFTRGSEIENAETSAVGRAIAMMGFEVKRGVSSREEVRNKQTDGTEPEAGRTTHRDGLLGIAEVGKARDSDFELRQAPDGFTLGFKLKGDGGGFKVLTRDELALQLTDLKDEVVGSRVTVWGRITDVRPGPNDKWRAYQVVHAEKLAAAGKILPVAASVDPTGTAFARPIGDEDLTQPHEDRFPPEVPVAPGQAELDLLDPESRAILEAAT